MNVRRCDFPENSCVARPVSPEYAKRRLALHIKQLIRNEIVGRFVTFGRGAGRLDSSGLDRF